MTSRREKTRQQLQQTFEEMLHEQPYEEITLEEVAKRVGRTRTTIYRHYKKKEDLLMDCFYEAIEGVKDEVVLDPAVFDGMVSQMAYHNLCVLYSHVADRPALYRALLTSEASPAVRSRFRRVVAGISMHMLIQGGTFSSLKAPTDMVSAMIAEMFVGAIVWWLESDSAHDPTVMAEVALRMVEMGTFGLARQKPIPSDASYRPFSIESHPFGQKRNRAE